MSVCQPAVLVCLVSLSSAGTILMAAQQQIMRRELLLFIEVPTVVTATGPGQPSDARRPREAAGHHPPARPPPCVAAGRFTAARCRPGAAASWRGRAPG